MTQSLDMVDQLRRKLNGETVDQIASLTVHFSDNCNLKCEHCSYAEQKEKIELSEKVVEELANHDPMYTCLVGGGEPTFLSHRDRFNELVSMLPNEKRVYMITNGIVIPDHVDEWGPKFDFIRVSLDAATPETYMTIKGANQFKKVIDNIGRLLDENINRVGVTFVAQGHNFHEAPQFFELVAPFYFKHGNRFFAKVKPLRGYEHLLPPKEDIQAVYDSIVEKASKSILFKRFLEEGTNFFELPNMYIPVTEKQPEGEKCYYSLLYVLVSARGVVYPCGVMSRKEMNSIGNLYSDSWEDVLQRQREFHEHINPRENEECKGCWDDDKNQILGEIIDKDLDVNPSLTKLGGIGNLYCHI